MAKKKQAEVIKQRYSYYCHQCGEKFNSDNIVHECQCGCSWLTVTDWVEPMSGYFVKGVRV